MVDNNLRQQIYSIISQIRIREGYMEESYIDEATDEIIKLVNLGERSEPPHPMLSDVCGWEITDPEYNVWQTTCGNATQIENDDTPLQNEWTYCPYCGKKIKEFDG